MKTVTIRSLRVVVPTRVKIMRTGADSSVNYTAQAEPLMGRLTAHKELARMKYCV